MSKVGRPGRPTFYWILAPYVFSFPRQHLLRNYNIEAGPSPSDMDPLVLVAAFYAGLSLFFTVRNNHCRELQDIAASLRDGPVFKFSPFPLSAFYKVNFSCIGCFCNVDNVLFFMSKRFISPGACA